MSYEDFVKELCDDTFHAVIFYWRGREYCYAGWWTLSYGHYEGNQYVEDWDIFLDRKDDFLTKPVFDGKTFAEIFPEVTVSISDFEME